jgi:hypothetical protein
MKNQGVVANLTKCEFSGIKVMMGEGYILNASIQAHCGMKIGGDEVIR